MNAYHKVMRGLISVLIVLALILGSVPNVSYAEVLSGTDSVTLSREPQLTPDGLGASKLGALEYANPSSQIDLAQPLPANNQGDARVSFPISVPPGRAGVQPDLSLSYSSTGGNSWVGFGWDLPVGSISVDTRWGVPRYSASQESETYLLDGDQLSPTAVRSTLDPRQADKVFQRRVEGAFERIVRHGTAPGNYWWEVTDKSGAHRFYGGTLEGGRDESAILTDAYHREFIWGLKQVRDISGNTVTYFYDKPAGTGVGLYNISAGQNLYLASIQYTGSITGNTPNDPPYQVDLLRESRPDVQVDGRGGFLRVTSERLKQVVIKYRGTVVRSYTLNYTIGAFGKSLLASVDQYGQGGSPILATHTFNYYDDLQMNGNTYRGFDANQLQAWNTQADNVSSGVDLSSFGDGKASALGGTQSIGGDGRVYIGFNLYTGTKDGSAGVGLVFKGEDNSSLLEMIDINGDNLPDKVFVQGGQIFYRLNQSGPGGTTSFSSGSPLLIQGINHLSEESNFMFSIGVELYFGVNVMYNHAWAWTWGKAYFTDVNADNLPDFIDQGVVYFNHLDANGQPVFTANSADTSVPVDSGLVNPALIPDLTALADQVKAQAPLQDVLRRWVAPWDGTVMIQGDVQLIQPASGSPAGDGVRLAIQHESSELWSAVIPGGDFAPQAPAGVDSINVSRGDDIYFRLQSQEDGASDQVAWNPIITYLNVVTPTLDANGLDVYSYQAAADFTLAGRSGSFAVMPLTGTVQAAGDFNKLRLTTDDITIQVFNNDTLISETLVDRNQTGITPFSVQIPVVGPGANSSGDTIRLALKIDSPVDLSAFSWTPQLTYLSATQNGQPVPVVDQDGNPIIQLNPPVDTQIYPGNDLSTPQGTWTSPTSGDVTLTPSADFICSQSCENDSIAGTMTISVKKKIAPQSLGDPAAELVAKKVLTIQGGLIQDSDPTLTFSAEQNAEYWIDLSVPQPRLGLDWVGADISASQNNTALSPVTFARHWAYIPADLFPEPYRGWGIAGYNGDAPWDSQPVDESRLLFNQDDYPTAAPTLIDPDNPRPSYPSDFTGDYKNPAQASSYAYAPVVVFDDNGTPTGYWRGAKNNLYGSAAGQSSSRLGPDSITLPAAGFAGASAVVIQSTTEADALAAGLGGLLGGSFAWGTSQGQSDYFDMNGDQFPDILGNGYVQYSQPRGGRDFGATPLTYLNSVRQDSSSSKTLNGGGDAAEIKADSKGKSNNPQSASTISSQRQRKSSGNSSATSSGSGDSSATSGSIGLSGGVGSSSTNTSADASPGADVIQSELADINGDGLPDRVLLHSNGRFTVSFNLGYAFDTQQIDWPGGALEQGVSQDTSLAPGLGFSYGAMAFSGGISLASSKAQSLVTWVDLNGDGMPDMLSNINGVIWVRFNTGANLTAPINFGSWQQGVIARTQSQEIAGGVDITVGIGPLCYGLCYIILNPGFHVGGGMSRQEAELKDINGDGFADHVFSVSDNQMAVLLNQTGRTNLLKSVTNPLGGSFTLDYTRAGNTVAQPFSQWVLSSVDVNDGRPGDGPDHQLTTYQYADNVYDALERTFLGYQTVTEEQRDTSLAGNPVIRSIVQEYRNETIFDAGLLASETLLFPDGRPFSKLINTWSLWDVAAQVPANLNPASSGIGLLGLTVFPQQVKSEFQSFDSSGALIKTTWNTFSYDALGNLLTIFDVGEPDIASDDLTAFAAYTDCQSSTWVSLPDSFRIEDNQGNNLRSRRAEVLCSNGAITKLWEDTGSGEAETALSFDDWGNYDQIIYPPNENGERYTVDYTYDVDRRTDIATITDSYGLQGTASYDGFTGQIASQTGANGETTTYTYDIYGRPESITGPYEQGSGNASVTFEYFPTAPGYAYALAHNFDIFHPGDPIDTASFMDGIRRITELKQDATLFQAVGQPAVDAVIVSGATEWDALGRAVKQWYPVSEPLGTLGDYNYNTPATSPTVVTYDINDRVIQTIAPDNSVTSTGYGFGGAAEFGTAMFQALYTDQLGKTTTTYSDARGNQIATVVNHQVGNALNVLKTQYQYDPLQQLIGITDPGGNQITHTYDLLGRHTAATTPDGGLVTFTYDLASHKVSQVTPNLRSAGGEIHYSYHFDQLTGITYTDGTPNVTYTYGGPGAPNNGAGRIIQVDDGARVQLRTYGQQGEITGETTTMLVHNLVDGTEARLTWTTAFDFDTWGRTKTITYPDGEVVSYAYDSGGLISAVSGEKAGISYPYLLRMEYDEFSAPRFTLYGNQVATETRYDAATRRLSRQVIDAPGRRIQDLNYTYDLTGNVLSFANNSPTPVSNMMGGPSQQTFVYDDLYRLVSATGTYNYSPNKTRTYAYTLTYDDTGNILNKTQTDAIIIKNPKNVLPQQKTTYNLDYSYNAAPHQPTQIGSGSYSYDLNGNFAGWTDLSSGRNRTVAWDAENRITSVSDQGSTTTYAYTEDGALGIQRGPGGEVAFVNRYYMVLNGNIAWKDIYAGDQRIAIKKQMPDGEPERMKYFLHKDLLGSTNLVTDPEGLIFQHLEYFPGGETWIEEHSDIFRTPELYTGSYYDEFRGLYNFGARWYEPREQMFYSPEPVLVQSPALVIGDPAMLPAYSYAQSNPVTLIDPDGMLSKQALLNWKASVSRKWNDTRNNLLTSLDPKTNEHSARFKKFVTFKFPPAVSIKLTRDPSTGEYTLKNVKLFGIKTEKIPAAFRSLRKK